MAVTKSESDVFRASLLKNINSTNENIFSIYPNPSSQSFKVSSSARLNYVIRDIQNIVVATGTAQPGTSLGASLKPGVYFLAVTNEKGSTGTVKLLKN